MTDLTLNNQLITYRRLRKAIGILGVLLPILLYGLSKIPILNMKVQPSISDYYFTDLRELFTGVLCAVGLFLILYKGYPNPNLLKNDGKLTNIAGIAAIGIAFFPTNPIDPAIKKYTLISIEHHLLGWVHYGFAAVFFITLSIISINVFTIGQKNNIELPKTPFDENNIYRLCGIVMLLCMALLLVFKFLNLFPNSTLFFETLMLFAFGLSWLVKGRILGDKGKIGTTVYREYH